MTAQPAQFPATGQVGTVWTGIGGNNPDILLVNQDSANTWYIGTSSNFSLGDPNTIPLGPGRSIVYGGNKTIYAAAQKGTAALLVVPDATSFFQPTTLNTLGGIKVFIQATAPTEPPVIPLNSIWLKTAGGNVVGFFTWNGAVWVQQAFDASTVIAVGTIIANLVAAGTVIAGIVNGTEIDGGILRAVNSFGATIMTVNKSSGTWLLYADNGSAVQGAIIASGAHASGVDEFGGAFQAGVVAYDGVGGFIQMSEAGNIASIKFLPGTATHVTKDANILGSVVNPGAVNEYEVLQLQSGAAGGLNVTTMQLLSDSADGTLTGVIKFFYQNSVVLAIEPTNVTYNQPILDTAGTPANPTIITTDNRRNFGAFGAGFGAGAPAPWQALKPDGVGGVGSIRLGGQIQSTAATAANATMVTLATAPAVQQDFVTPTNANGYTPAAGSLPRVVRVDTAGNVRLIPSTSAATQFVMLDGIEVILG